MPVSHINVTLIKKHGMLSSVISILQKKQLGTDKLSKLS